jgi:hypothetical protein
MIQPDEYRLAQWQSGKKQFGVLMKTLMQPENQIVDQRFWSFFLSMN